METEHPVFDLPGRGARRPEAPVVADPHHLSVPHYASDIARHEYDERV
jgi:hypothetical protein